MLDADRLFGPAVASLVLAAGANVLAIVAAALRRRFRPWGLRAVVTLLCTVVFALTGVPLLATAPLSTGMLFVFVAAVGLAFAVAGAVFLVAALLPVRSSPGSPR